MKINMANIKFIEWRNPEGLHEDTLGCISDLEFINDELNFLSELISEHTLELISDEPFEEIKKIVEDLGVLKKKMPSLLKEVKSHKNRLQTLMDDIDVPDEMNDYKTDHYKLMFEAVAFNSKFKKLKKRIFTTLKKVMKENRKKRLLK